MYHVFSARAIVEYMRKYCEKTCVFPKRRVFPRKTLRFRQNRSVKRSAFRPNAAFFSTWGDTGYTCKATRKVDVPYCDLGYKGKLRHEVYRKL